MRFSTGIHASAGRSRRPFRVTATLVAMALASTSAVAQERSAAADWPTYNRDLAGTRYSPLEQIDTSNVGELQEVWSYRFHPEDGFIEGPSPAELFQQVTPIVVDGVMYLASGNRVVACSPRRARRSGGTRLAEGWRRSAASPTDRHRRPRGPHLLHQPVEVIALKAATGERDPASATAARPRCASPTPGCRWSTTTP